MPIDVLPQGLVHEILDVLARVDLHVGKLLSDPLPEPHGRPHELVVGLADWVEVLQVIEGARALALRGHVITHLSVCLCACMQECRP